MINISSKPKPTKAEREAIVEWLMLPMGVAKYHCPFRKILEYNNTPQVARLCASWFPKGMITSGYYQCPCSHYPRKTVVKYANMMLRARSK